jgi:hypothetical protein
MPLLKYIDKRFKGARAKLVEQANEIITEYAGDGMRLTLRQLYYQFVARGLFGNKLGNYKRLGGAVSDGRLMGLIDWDAIEDRARNVQDYSSWENPEQILRSAARGFKLDRWHNQLVRVICLIEKEALAGVFDQACGQYDVPLLPCKGYLSQSEMWAMAMRIRDHTQAGQPVVLLHFGDHDPSGIDMTRDIIDRIRLLTFGIDVQVKRGQLREEIALWRLALNMDQVKQYDPPPNPAKETDARFKDYEAKFGDESWELDALEPKVLRDLVRKQVMKLVDQELWDDTLAKEDELRKDLDHIAKHFPVAAKAARKAAARKPWRKRAES